MKTPVRIGIFALGVGLIFFGWYKGHSVMVDLQNGSPAPSNAYPFEILAVGGAFLVLVAFAPSPATLSRWMSRKRRKPVPHARFRRRKD
jgi:hypothetical protein